MGDATLDNYPEVAIGAKCGTWVLKEYRDPMMPF